VSSLVQLAFLLKSPQALDDGFGDLLSGVGGLGEIEITNLLGVCVCL